MPHHPVSDAPGNIGVGFIHCATRASADAVGLSNQEVAPRCPAVHGGTLGTVSQRGQRGAFYTKLSAIGIILNCNYSGCKSAYDAAERCIRCGPLG